MSLSIQSFVPTVRPGVAQASPASFVPASARDLVELGRGPHAMGPDPITPMFNALVGGAAVGAAAGGYLGFRAGSHFGMPVVGAVAGALVGAVGVGVFAASVAVR